MSGKIVIGVDLGGTKVAVGKVNEEGVLDEKVFKYDASGTENDVVNVIVEAIAEVFDKDVAGIGVGVPSIVDPGRGVVYDVQNIPSWKEVHLKDILERRFGIPVFINNDANCFILGEKYYGKGKPYKHLIGLTLGTGLGTGIVVNGSLYCGVYCGAGEFCSVPYRDRTYEDYCSGKFFRWRFGVDGREVFERAIAGDEAAHTMYREFGYHLGNAIKSLMFIFAPEAVILGGSISEAYVFFRDALLERLDSFPYKKILEGFRIEVSSSPGISVLGAAALCYS